MGRKRGCLVVLVAPMMLVLIVLLGLIARPDLKHYVPGWKYYAHYQHFAHTPLSASAPSVEIARGDSLHTVLLKLRKAGVQSGSDWEWQLLAYQVGAAGNLKFGDYALVPAFLHMICYSVCVRARVSITASLSLRVGTFVSCALRYAKLPLWCIVQACWMMRH